MRDSLLEVCDFDPSLLTPEQDSKIDATFHHGVPKSLVLGELSNGDAVITAVTPSGDILSFYLLATGQITAASVYIR